MIRLPPRSALFPYTTPFRSTRAIPGGSSSPSPRRACSGATTPEIGRAHVCTPVTLEYRMPPSACKKKKCIDFVDEQYVALCEIGHQCDEIADLIDHRTGTGA